MVPAESPEGPLTIVVSAPSGAGKTTLNRMLLASEPSLKLSISLTTRSPRSTEAHGREYFFVTRAQFQDAVDQSRMLEWAEVHGQWYGTSLDEIRRIQDQGCSPLLEIDVKGWIQVKKKLKNVRSIFIFPPDLSTLWERLTRRGTDRDDVLRQRFATAREEIRQCSLYDHFLINDDLSGTLRRLSGLCHGKSSEGLDRPAAMAHRDRLLQEFQTSPWIEEAALHG